MENNSYLSFELGGELFAIHVNKVLTILEMQKITTVPKSPDYLKGVINLRGTVLPVVDTHIKVGMKPTEYTKNTCIIVMEIDIDNEKVSLGAIVDAVKEVLDIPDESILPPPGVGSKYQSDFITGIFQENENFIMLLDIDQIFSADDISILVNEETENKPVEETNTEEKAKRTKKVKHEKNIVKK